MGHTSRKRTWMFKSRQKSLLGFCGITVSGYVSTIFINGKATCLKAFLQQSRFQKTFSMLVSHSCLDETFFRT